VHVIVGVGLYTGRDLHVQFVCIRVIKRKKEIPYKRASIKKGIGSSVDMQAYKGGWASHLGGTSS